MEAETPDRPILDRPVEMIGDVAERVERAAVILEIDGQPVAV